MRSADYRADIDWLRAVAVLVVVGFHFGIAAFRGGFVGVDVFFVISGYLIGGIVFAELAEGRFSFAGFWRRRALRILPALYVMAAATMVPALYVLLRQEQAPYFRSLASMAVFASNLFFWSHSGYFDHTAADAPLLHTWSLAVEEQFYIAFPLIAFGLHRLAAAVRVRGVLPAGLAVLAGLSLLFSIRLVATGEAPDAFFLPQFRAWEFLCGAIPALFWRRLRLPPRLAAAAKIVGLVAIGAAVNGYTDGTPFPGADALLPCLGAVLFIASGPLEGPRGRLFTAVEFVGRISYSLYLWHWPLYTLARLQSVGQSLSPLETAGLFVALLVVAWLSYRYVEQPCRRWRGSGLRVLGAGGVGAAALCGIAALGVFGRGAAEDRGRLADLMAYEAVDKTGEGACFVAGWTADNHADCLAGTGGPAILLWGDSMAAHYRPGLEAVLKGRGIELLQATAPGCLPTVAGVRQLDSCNVLGRRVASFVAGSHPAMVIISAFWIAYVKTYGLDAVVRDLRETIDRLGASGTHVVVFGPGVGFSGDLPKILMRAAAHGLAPGASDVLVPGLVELDRQLALALAGSGAAYLSPLAAECAADQCRLMVAPGVPLTWDFAHLTVQGSEFVVRALWPALQAAMPHAAAASGG